MGAASCAFQQRAQTSSRGATVAADAAVELLGKDCA